MSLHNHPHGSKSLLIVPNGSKLIIIAPNASNSIHLYLPDMAKLAQTCQNTNYCATHILKTKMSLNCKCYQNANVTQNKFLPTKICHQNKMSLISKCYQNANVTKTQMSLKPICYNKENKKT